VVDERTTTAPEKAKQTNDGSTFTTVKKNPKFKMNGHEKMTKTQVNKTKKEKIKK